MRIIPALALFACAVNVRAAVAHYPTGTLGQAMPASPIVIHAAHGLIPAIAQPSLVSAQMAMTALASQKMATPIAAAATVAKQSLPASRETLPQESKRSWEVFLMNDKVQSEYVDGNVMNDGSVKLDTRGKHPLNKKYAPPLKSALSAYFPGRSQPLGRFELNLPPTDEFSRTTRNESGFQVVFPKKVDAHKLSFDGFGALLAKGKFPMMELDDLFNHWPRLVELKGMAPVYADIAGTALSIGAGSDKKSSKNEVGWRNDLKAELIIMLHDFASINGKVLFRDRPTSNPSKVFPAALEKSAEFLNVIIGRLSGVRPTIRKDLIVQLADQGPFGRALADKLKTDSTIDNH